MEFVHKSVLFDEAIEALDLNSEKVILDGTAGGGGHSSEISKTAKQLIAVDQDPDAITVLNERLGDRKNVTIVHDNFSHIKSILKSLNIDKIDGVLLDLGVSSFQLDTADRGFSFHKDAPLDMRMSKTGLSAKDVVNTYSETELADVIFKYGEEKFARKIASNIVKARQDKPIETTFELVDIIKASLPQKAMRDSHPARKTFQAIRIEVNGELDVLKSTLDDAFDCLNSGGRIAVITFHSLEDRIVKDFFKLESTNCICDKSFPVCVCHHVARLKLINKKVIVPSEKEIKENKRSSSSKLRIAERI